MSFPVRAAKPNKGNFQLVCSHCAERTGPTTPSTERQEGAEPSLLTNRKCLQRGRSICYCEPAAVSSRMFGIPSGSQFLARRRSRIPPASYLFIKRRRGEPGGRQVNHLTCVRVDEPQSAGQQGADHKGCEGDAHHGRSVQHVQRA